MIIQFKCIKAVFGSGFVGSAFRLHSGSGFEMRIQIKWQMFFLHQNTNLLVVFEDKKTVFYPATGTYHVQTERQVPFIYEVACFQNNWTMIDLVICNLFYVWNFPFLCRFIFHYPFKVEDDADASLLLKAKKTCKEMEVNVRAVCMDACFWETSNARF